jgi:hypothetical protein
MYSFCTYFDCRYLVRGLALYQSLKQHCSPFQLWVLCMDSNSYEVLSELRLPNVHLIALEEFEKGDERLLEAKKTRSLIEYYFTCSPSLPLYVLNNCPEVNLITYLDADLFFFADPSPLYNEIAHHSISIIGHRFPPNLRDQEIYGRYNVGFLSFRRDEQGLACLHWWRDRCLEWCYDRAEDGRFADQKYLDAWPTLFSRTVVLDHKGANLAPWNLSNYTVSRKRGKIWVDEQPLIFFHFHGSKSPEEWFDDPSWAFYQVKPSKVVGRHIYEPYVRTMAALARETLPLTQRFPPADELRGKAPRSLSPQSLRPKQSIMSSIRRRMRISRIY